LTAVLEARGLSLRRGASLVVRDVSLQLRAGEAVALVGPNAAGKSTLVRGLAGLLPPAEGAVLLHGDDLRACARDAAARAIALVASDEGAPPAITVAERARLGRYPHRGALRPFTAEDDAKVASALERAGVGALAARALSTLSAGERQRAALARGLAQGPQALLLDEPAAHLDVGHQLELFRVLDDVRATGMAVLTVVHDLQRAAAWAERMVLLAGGRIVAEGPPAEVLASAAAAAAFGVAIRGHAVPGAAHPLYTFSPR
jgi:iron complex transport system ATP-binding protein